jgi:hypothetical protein
LVDIENYSSWKTEDYEGDDKIEAEEMVTTN